MCVARRGGGFKNKEVTCQCLVSHTESLVSEA